MRQWFELHLGECAKEGMGDSCLLPKWGILYRTYLLILFSLLPVPYICSAIRKWPKGLHPSLKSNSFLFPFRMAHNYWSELPPPPPAARRRFGCKHRNTFLFTHPSSSFRQICFTTMPRKKGKILPPADIKCPPFLFCIVRRPSAFFLKYISVGEKRGRR